VQEKNLTIVITGSVAFYKSIELIRLFMKSGIIVRVILTKSALKFITPLAISAITGQKTHTELFCPTEELHMNHIHLTRKSDAMLICPATADILAKIATGMADELATTSILAAKCPIIYAPAMNAAMWENQATQHNIGVIKQRGGVIIPPQQQGVLACGEEGAGKLAEIMEIYEKVMQVLDPLNKLPSQSSQNNTKPRQEIQQLPEEEGEQPTASDNSSNNASDDLDSNFSDKFCDKFAGKLKGKNILITAGGTIEKIDAVRYISNFSSGTQGVMIARQALLFGGLVHLIITTNSDKQMFVENILSLPKDILENLTITEATSAENLLDAVLASTEKVHFDIGIFSAAVADYKPKTSVVNKLKKQDMGDEFTINLTKNPDILGILAISENRPKILVGFAAETENLIENAKVKLQQRNIDIIIANNISDGAIFGSKKTSAQIIAKSGIEKDIKSEATEQQTPSDGEIIEEYQDITKIKLAEIILTKLANKLTKAQD